MLGCAAVEGIVGPLILVVCLGALILSFRRARIRTRGYERSQNSPLAATITLGEQPTPGTSAEIADGGAVPTWELGVAMREVDAPELSAEGEDDGVAPLGLTLLVGGGENGLAQVMHGTRQGHQVFIRQGLIGDSLSPGMRLRRFRSITVVRVAAPVFEARYGDGGIEPDEQAPPELREMLLSLSPSPEVWKDGRLVSGAKGIAVSRATANDWLGGWLYDLWLLEALARKADAKPLKEIRLNRGWKAPYGLHDWAPGLLERE